MLRSASSLLTGAGGKTSSRPRDEAAGSFSSRRGHTSQLSISDPSHHVTEAIGTLYGDEDDSGSEGGRPLSFIDGSSYHEQIHRPSQPEIQEQLHPHQHEHDPRRPLTRSLSEQPPNASTPYGEHPSLRKIQTLPIPSSSSQRGNSFEQGSRPPLSPTLSLRDVQAESVGSPFSLTNIDNPSDIAQELSNLQALRRLSMDVGNNINPDLPPMSLSAMPMIAPSGDDDENDPSRLLWVPARVHPELAPTEFKSFLEKRVQSIKRRSGDPFISADVDLGRSGSVSSLRRQKSMLSRQIDNSGGRGAVGYVDGAERLKRQRSSGGSQLSPELSLEELVKDPSRAVRRFAQESQEGSGGIEGSGDDMPILPMAPGIGLRRSTRTTYRKGGSLRSGDRGSLSRRLAHRHQPDSESSGADSPAMEAPKGHSLARVQSEPVAENYSRPKRSVRRQNRFPQDLMAGTDGVSEDSTESRTTSPPRVHQDQLPVRTSSASASTTSMEPNLAPERAELLDNQYSRSFPQRSSSQSAEPPLDHQAETVVEEPRSNLRSANNNVMKQPAQPQYTSKSPPLGQMQTTNDTLPSSLSGGDASRTDNLTFIPTLSQVEKKPEKKSKKDRDEDSSSSRSGSAWKWFKGVTDDREKKKEESKKSKSKALAERAQDNVRLDVIQTSIDKNAVKGRESLVLDRDHGDNKLVEERKKESHRKKRLQERQGRQHLLLNFRREQEEGGEGKGQQEEPTPTSPRGSSLQAHATGR